MTNATSGAGAIFALGSSSVAEWTSATLNIDGRSIDVTSINSTTFKEYIMGKLGGTINLEGNFHPGDTNGQLALLNAILGRTKLTGTSKPKLSNSSGGPNISGDGFVENFKWTAPHDDKQGFTCTVRFTSTIAYSAT